MYKSGGIFVHTKEQSARVLRACLVVVIACALVACSPAASTSAPATNSGGASPTTAPTAQSVTAVATDTVTSPSATQAVATDTPQAAATDTPAAQATATVETSMAAATSGAPSGVSSDMLDVLHNMVQALSQIKSGRMSMVITTTKSVFTATAEFVSPNLMHLTTYIAGQTMEELVVSDTLYLNMGGKWTTASGFSGNILGMTNFVQTISQTEQFATSIVGAQALGADSVNGVPTQVYQYQLRNSAHPLTSTLTIWLGGDNLPYRIDSASPISATGQVLTTTASVLYYDYNAAIVIPTPPAQ